MTKIPDNSHLDWREQRRLLAWQLYQQGWSQPQIARELGVTQGAVSQWLKKARFGGTEALRRGIAPGRQRLLPDDQLAQIPILLAQGARAYGFESNRWTIQRISTVLTQQFGITYHPAHVSRILKTWCPNWRTIADES